MSQQPSTNNELRNVLSDGLTELFTILLFGSMPKQTTYPQGQEQKDEFVPRFRFSAYYDVFGDTDGVDWMNSELADAEEDGLIADYEVLLSLRGYMGIQTVTFTFDVDIPGETGYLGMLEKGTEIANEIVGDSDAKAYGVTVVNLPDDTDGDEPEEEPLAQWEIDLLQGPSEADIAASDEALAVLREKLTGETREETAARLQASEQLHASQVEEQELNTIDHNPGKELCYDDWSGRYFRANMNHIADSVNKVNAIINTEGDACLNDYYDILGLTGLPMGTDFGWSGSHVIVSYGSFISPSGEPVLSVSFRTEPKPNLGQYR